MPPPGWIVERRHRFPARLFHQRVIAQQIADPQRRRARLARAEEVAGAALNARSLGDLNPSVVSVSAFSRFLALIGNRILIQQDAA
jgi:hypothetical protein